jgi:ankyrin repeat protein
MIYKYSTWDGLPSEIRLEIFWRLDFETLASLARVDKGTKATAEEVLYRKDALRPSSPPEAGFWAAKNNLLSTLNKFISFNESRTDVDTSTLVNAKWMIPHPWRNVDSDDDYLGPPWLWNESLPRLRYLSALHFAAEGGHDAIVARLIEEGANINAGATSQGFMLLCNHSIGEVTPLYYALVNGNASTASLLLEKGASQNIAISEFGGAVFTALHFAIFANLTTVVDELLTTYNANVSYAAVDGVAPIHMAVLSPDTIDYLQKLIVAGALVSPEFKFGVKPPLPALPVSSLATIFHLLIMLEDEEVSLKAFNVLRAAGLSIDTEDARRISPVHRAIDAFKPSIANRLLEQGFGLFHGAFSKENCLLFLWRAINYSYTFKKYPKSPDCVLRCAKLLVNAEAEVVFDVVKAFLDIGEFQVADFLFPYINNQPSNTDDWVVSLEPKIDRLTRHNIGILEFLIRNCPPNLGGIRCLRWKDLIIDFFHSPVIVLDCVITLLMQHAEEGLTKSVDGCNNLMGLLRNPSYSHALHRDLVRHVFECGAKPDDKDYNGNTYIHHLLENEGIEEHDLNSAVALLLEIGVDLNAQNRNGQTTLHHVAKRLKNSRRNRQNMPKKYEQLTRGFNKIDALLHRGALRNNRDKANMTSHDILEEEEGMENMIGKFTKT